MKAIAEPALPSRGAAVECDNQPRRSPAPTPETRPAEDIAPGPYRVSLRVQLQAMDSLTDVLVTVSRLGASIESFAGANDQLELVALAREPVARRMPGLIEQLIAVLAVDVRELTHAN